MTQTHLKHILQLYTDDVWTYLSGLRALVEDLMQRINEDLSRTSLWSDFNNLKLKKLKLIRCYLVPLIS